MPYIQLVHTFEHIISLENLLLAWKEFVVGKKSRKDAQEFQRNLISNVISLHLELRNKIYKHSKYEWFRISDPKPRDIHKAKVKDRLLHHALYRVLYPFFDRTFIVDSYSCRVNKGVYKAIDRFNSFVFQVSKNQTKTCWILKCDIKKFFANIDQVILLKIIKKYISDQNIIWLLSVIIGSFDSGIVGVGLPLGNLTSQLFVNIYMNEFDQFVKHKLRVKHYIRYADDFVFMHHDKSVLIGVLFKVKSFLEEQLKLSLHSNKVFFKTVSSGVDFLGWVHFSNYRVLRTITRRRMFKKIFKLGEKQEVVQSYVGLLGHGNAEKLKQKICDIIKK